MRVREITINGMKVSGVALAEKFNECFVELLQRTHSEDASRHAPSGNESLFLCPTDENEILSVFQNLEKNSKSSDIYDLQIKPIKYVLRLVILCLANIFNLALNNITFPKKKMKKKMKLAKILHKAGNKNILENYRPGSILPIFSKGLEEVIHQKLNSLCENLLILTLCIVLGRVVRRKSHW